MKESEEFFLSMWSPMLRGFSEGKLRLGGALDFVGTPGTFRMDVCGRRAATMRFPTLGLLCRSDSDSDGESA
jgi:hypothetical protein